MLEFVGYDVLKPQIVWGPAQIHGGEASGRISAAWRERLNRIAQEEPIVVGSQVKADYCPNSLSQIIRLSALADITPRFETAEERSTVAHDAPANN